MEKHSCPVCEGKASKKCGGCGNVFYCTKDHQKQHWRKHKPNCRAFEVKKDSVLGRHMLATRDIKVGVVIIRESPLIRAPTVNSSPVCLACLKSISPGCSSPCPKCGWPLCLKAACRQSIEHVPECEWRRKRKKKPTGFFLVTNTKYKVIVALRLCYARCHQPELWDKLSKLETHTAERLHTNNYQEGEKFIVRTLREDYDLPVTDDEILDMLGIFAVNGQEVLGPEEHYIAVYDMASLVENSCYPNCSPTLTPDGEITVRAGRDILKGDHISVCYTDINWGTTSRYKKLLLNSYFSCKCIRCTDNTEMGTYYSAILCQASGCGGFMLPPNLCELTPTTLWTCMSCGVTVPNVIVEELLDLIKIELNRLDFQNFSALLIFMMRWKHRLHPNHFYLTGVKITWAFGKAMEIHTPSLPDDLLHIQIGWFRHLNELLDVIAPVELAARNIYKNKLLELLVDMGDRLHSKGKVNESDKIMMEASKYIGEVSMLSKYTTPPASLGTKKKIVNRFLNF